MTSVSKPKRDRPGIPTAARRRRPSSPAALVAIAFLVLAGCGGRAGGSPAPTPNTPDPGECVELTGPDNDLQMTVVDCSATAADYEVLDVIDMLTSKAACPAAADLELERTLQFVKSGQTANPSGGMRTQRYCLRDLGAATPLPTASPGPTAPSADVDAEKVTYTTNTTVGGTIALNLTLKNSGPGKSAPISLTVGELGAYADARKCTPACEIAESAGVISLEFADGVASGASTAYRIEFKATKAGVVKWNVTIYEGSDREIFHGTGTTTIK
jgi:hypothetical protein